MHAPLGDARPLQGQGSAGHGRIWRHESREARRRPFFRRGRQLKPRVSNLTVELLITSHNADNGSNPLTATGTPHTAKRMSLQQAGGLP